MKRLVPVLISIALLASCGKKPVPAESPSSALAGSSGPAGAPTGGATVEEAFQRARDCAARKDFGGMVDIISPEDLDLLVFYSRMLGAFTTGADEMKKKEREAILLKHGVAEMTPDADLGMMDRAKLMKALAEMFKDVKDKRGFCVETLTFIERNAPPGRQSMFDFEGTLQDVKESGDSATATVVKSGSERTPLEFRRTLGRWYLGLPQK